MYRFLVSVLILTLCCGCIDHPNDKLVRKGVLARLTTYAEAINFLAADCGRKRVLDAKMPEVLDALYRNPGWPGWKGPYLIGQFIDRDGWEMPYKFEFSGSSIRLISGGPDRIIGTGDDVIVVAQMPGVITNDAVP